MPTPHAEIYEDRADGTRVHTGWQCQQSTCMRPAEHQWQRLATTDEVAADAATVGNYGDVYRNAEGPHHSAVFACATHAPHRPSEDPRQPDVPDLEAMARVHAHDCTAPDPGCVCD